MGDNCGSKCTKRSDLDDLREKSLHEGGFRSSEDRRKAWPKLLGVNAETPTITHTWGRIEKHNYYQQVLLDVNRMRSLMPPGLSEEEENETKGHITTCIVSVLLENPELHYYQGFHDICYVFYSVLGVDMAIQCINSLVKRSLKVFMAETMDPAEQHLFHIYVLLYMENPALLRSIEDMSIQSSFALAWVLTWFTHVLPDLRDIVRLYDLFIADESSLMPIYVSVAIILLSMEEVTDNMSDFGELYQCLTHLPKRHNVELIVQRTIKLKQQHPVDKLLTLAAKYMPLLKKGSRSNKMPPRLTSGGPIELYYLKTKILCRQHPMIFRFLITTTTAVIAYGLSRYFLHYHPR